MIRKLFILMFVVLTSCSNSNISSVDNTSFKAPSTLDINSAQFSDSNVLNTTNDNSLNSHRFNANDSMWGKEIGLELQKAIGMDLPAIQSFPMSQVKYQCGFEANNKLLPYVNIYFENCNNFIIEYKEKLTALRYTFKGVSKEEDVEWYEYKVYNVNNQEVNVRFAYYYNEGKNYFDIYTYLSTSGGGLIVNEIGDFTLSEKHFSNSYPKTVETIQINQIDFEIYYTMKQDSAIQMKKGENAFIRNIKALPSVYSLYLDQIQGEFQLEIGDYLDQLEIVTPSVLNVYPLNGAKYFKLTNIGNIVGKINQIVLTF